MANFDVKCPDHYPMKCNLSPADKEYLVTDEKYKAFLNFQYKDNDEYLEPVLGKYFNNRNWKLFHAGNEAGRGTKFCNICRYALASDFGIAFLTPLNYNVFQEIGLMLGLQKPLFYLYNPERLKEGDKLPFDIDDQIYIQYTSQAELEQKLDKEMGLLINQVELYSEYEKRFRESVQEKVKRLSPKDLEVLELFLIENRPLGIKYGSLEEGDRPTLACLEKAGLIITTAPVMSVNRGSSNTLIYRAAWEINPEYRDVLREIVFTRKMGADGGKCDE